MNHALELLQTCGEILKASSVMLALFLGATIPFAAIYGLALNL